MRAILLSGGLSLILSLIGTRYAIRVLKAKGYGQEIREEGPESHKTKRGTPTMGGIVIIFATLLSYFAAKLLTGEMPTASALLLLFLFAGCGLVGFLDDFIKIYRARNLGLRSRAKMAGQTFIALVFAGVAISPWLEDSHGMRPASLHISVLRDWEAWTIPAVLVMVLIWFIITGTSNAVNLTDGLDGLAAGASVMVFGAYTLINIFQSNQTCFQDPVPTLGQCYQVRDPLDLAIVASAITGACFGFLWWNASPAKIFMGDTGSLALGGGLAGLAILTRTELLLLVLGGLFVMETLSVMMQVSYFKATKGKRIFRMAPIHHHFEMLGWEQVTVVIRFWIITGLLVAGGLGLFYAEWVSGV
jgi:phospho-N-acetylmuramoyl-pentapeptide-transferase